MSGLRPIDILLAPASVLYGAAVETRAALYHASVLRPRRLKGRVVSIGNLTVGGTGKTPTVIALAELLSARGHRLGVLTRGYGRSTNEVVVLNCAKTPWNEIGAVVARAGDEPVLLSRHLPEIPISIAADRYVAGRLLEEKHGVNLFLLDDGFQHLRLHRDADIVLLDATAEDDALLPRGRRREPWSALARAHIVLITRTEQAVPAPWIDRTRAVNPGAAVFCAETALDSLHEAATHAPVPAESVKGKRVFAFCGIGNHRAFSRNLADWGFQLQAMRVFPDHHRYGPDDLGGFLRAAEHSRSEALLTTEKDIINWRMPGPTELPMYYCRIRLKIDQPDRMLAEIERRLEASAL